MRQAVLDTDILSEYLKGHHTTVAGWAAVYAAEHATFSFTSVTVYEILYGLEVKAAGRQRAKVLAWLNQNEEITPTAAVSRLAASSKATAKLQGSIVELPDCLSRRRRA